MLVIVKVLRAVAAGCAVAILAGCTSAEDPDPAPDTTVIDANAVTAALLAPADIGPTWKVSKEALHPTPLMAMCGGGEEAPPVPGGPAVAASPLVDEGNTGLQTFDQVALVYAEPADATGAVSALKVDADACARSISVPADFSESHKEAAYTETLDVSQYSQGEWSGFVVERHKLYELAHPGAIDTAVAVLTLHNVVLVDSYAIYVLGSKAAAPQFSTDWRKLVGSTVTRIGPV